MKNIVHIVTHGQTCPGSNPAMTAIGFQKVKSLRSLLPANIAHVICGTGTRHVGVRLALGLVKVETDWNSAVGGPEIIYDDMVILADGLTFPAASCTTGLFITPALLNILANVSPDTVICAGVEFLLRLGKTQVFPATLYRVSWEGAPLMSNLAIKTIQEPGVCEGGD